jgi:hypothetical protein
MPRLLLEQKLSILLKKIKCFILIQKHEPLFSLHEKGEDGEYFKERLAPGSIVINPLQEYSRKIDISG